MAKNEKARVQPKILDADENTYLALKAIGSYKPVNAAYAIDKLSAKYEALRTAKETELNAQNAFSAARDALIAVGWDFHNTVLGAKNQVVAQYGEDSDELASLGLKKKSDRKAPARAAKPAAKAADKPS